MVSCASTPTAKRPVVTVRSSSVPTSAAASATPAIELDTRQDGVLGPGGMTLRQEIGAVIMVGLTEPLTPAILDDWRQRQFGGLRLLPTDQHPAAVAAPRACLDSVRAVMTHPPLAARQRRGL